MADNSTTVAGPIYESEDWHSRHLPVWIEILRPLVGQPIRALEIGSWEGRSARWLLDNVLTHPEARLWCVDLFDDAVRESRFDHNVAGRFVRKWRGPSRECLPSACASLGLEAFDFIYIDGSHEAPDVLFDAALCFELLKVGGLLCFDDFSWSPGVKDGGVHAPKLAISCFCAVNEERLQVLQAGLQVWIRRTA